MELYHTYFKYLDQKSFKRKLEKIIFHSQDYDVLTAIFLRKKKISDYPVPVEVDHKENEWVGFRNSPVENMVYSIKGK